MKNLLIASAMLATVACTPFANKESNQDKEGAKGRTLKVQVQDFSGFGLIESAYVTSADLVCGTSTQSLSFTASQQSVVLFQSLQGCDVNLTGFVVENELAPVMTYSLTNRNSNGFAVFDGNDGGSIADTKLAKGSVTLNDYCEYEGNCDFDEATASFIYSELLRETKILENNLSITALDVEIEKEPAPKCDVAPAFEQIGTNAPELVIDFSNCVDLFNHEVLELTIFEHNGTSYGIEDLHNAINIDLSDYDAGSDFEIRLTVADLMQIAGTTDIFEALSTDLVIATRNKDGMSIKYYVIDNDCEFVEHSPLGGCETAFAYGSTTFIDLGLGNNRWGWQLDVPVGTTSSTPLYAGAGQNNIANGTHVGNLNYAYDGSTLTVSYDLFAPYGLNETHLYAGTTDISTTAPGQYGNQHENLNLAQSDSYTISIASQTGIKIVAHAEVCDAN